MDPKSEARKEDRKGPKGTERDRDRKGEDRKDRKGQAPKGAPKTERDRHPNYLQLATLLILKDLLLDLVGDREFLRS